MNVIPEGPSPSQQPADSRATYVTVLTPAGRGAVATVLVQGPLAARAVLRYFRPAVRRAADPLPLGRVLFGRWVHSAEAAAAGEELVVCRVRPATVEVHCHGGDAAVQALLVGLIAAGAEQISWQHYATLTAGDRLTAEAHSALAQCVTQRAAEILLDQYQGALRRALEAIRAACERGDDRQATELTATLMSRAALGLHLTQPWKVVLAGPPNVGKSSLINALVGYQRVIVYDQPGTTRDVVGVTTAIHGWPVLLSDTAGLRASTDPIESAGVARALERLEQADLAVLVTAAGDEPADFTFTVAQLPARQLQVLNKVDRLGHEAHSPADPADPRPSRLRTVATTGQGIPELLAAIEAALVPSPPEQGEAVPFTARQVHLLGQLSAALATGDRDLASRQLAALLE